MNVGIIYARGRGSSLKQKNIYPLNGTPMLAHFIGEMLRAECVDHIAVWTECAEVARVAGESGAVVLDRPREMVHYESGFSEATSWGKVVTDLLEKTFGHLDYCMNFNCNYVLFRAQTLDDMMQRLQADKDLGFIYAVSPVRDGIYVENHVTHNPMPLFPLLPGLVRRMGISISEVNTGASGRTHHEVSWEEGRDVQHADDIPFAEYVLRTRGR